MPPTFPNELVLMTLEYSLTFEAPTKRGKQPEVTPQSARDILTFRSVSRNFANVADNLLPKVLERKRVQMTATDLDMLERFTRREAVSKRMRALLISTALPIKTSLFYKMSELDAHLDKQLLYYSSATEALTTIASRLVNLQDVTIEGDPSRQIQNREGFDYWDVVEHTGAQAHLAVLEALSKAGSAPTRVEMTRFPIYPQGFPTRFEDWIKPFPSTTKLDISIVAVAQWVHISDKVPSDPYAENLLPIYSTFPNVTNLHLNTLPACLHAEFVFKQHIQNQPYLHNLTRLELPIDPSLPFTPVACRYRHTLRHLALYAIQSWCGSDDGILEHVRPMLINNVRLETLYLQLDYNSYTPGDLLYLPWPPALRGSPPAPFAKRIYVRPFRIEYGRIHMAGIQNSLSGADAGWQGVFGGDFEIWLGDRDDYRQKEVWAPMALPAVRYFD